MTTHAHRSRAPAAALVAAAALLAIAITTAGCGAQGAPPGKAARAAGTASGASTARSSSAAVSAVPGASGAATHPHRTREASGGSAGSRRRPGPTAARAAAGRAPAPPAKAAAPTHGGPASSDRGRTASSSPRAGHRHALSSYVSLGLPSPGQASTATSAAKLTPGLAQYIAVVQLAGATGRLSPPVRDGRPIVVASHGMRLFSLTLRTRYMRGSGVASVSLRLANLGVPSAQARRTIVRARVTLGYVG